MKVFRYLNRLLTDTYIIVNVHHNQYDPAYNLYLQYSI